MPRTKASSLASGRHARQSSMSDSRAGKPSKGRKTIPSSAYLAKGMTREEIEAGYDRAARLAETQYAKGMKKHEAALKDKLRRIQRDDPTASRSSGSGRTR